MEYLDFLISQIVKEHAGPITDCSADQKSEANGRVQPLDYDFADGRRTILEIGGAEEDRTPDLLRARQALSQLSYGPFNSAQNRKLLMEPTRRLPWKAAGLFWWGWGDLNGRPHPYQGCALTN